MKLSTAHKIGRFFQYFVLILVGVIMIYPLVWMVGATFKSNAEIFSGIGFLTANPTLQGYIDAVTQNYGGDISVSDIADFVGVSRSQLYRAFQTEFQMSPHAYLQNYRISEACTLLRRGTLTVAQVAGSVGFNDPLYFSRVFRRQKGCTPTAYQKRK